MSFDKYAHTYPEIINSVSRLSGETYESIIRLRMDVLLDEVGVLFCATAGLTVLDFGCGTGATGIYLQGLFPQAAITGVDASAESIRVAVQRQLERTTFLHSDTARLPFADATFDLIYTNGTMHHIPADDRRMALSELGRILKPAGMLCIFENNPRNPLTVRSMRQNPFDEGLQAVGPAELTRLAAQCGLSPLRPRYYFFFPRMLKRLRPFERHLKRFPFGAQYLLRLERDASSEE